MDEKEYIERSKIFEVWRSIPAPASVTSLSAAIHQTPAADVAPVRHGRWKYDNSVNFWKCSHCGENAPLLGKFMQLKTKYCPNCGARMDLE